MIPLPFDLCVLYACIYVWCQWLLQNYVFFFCVRALLPMLYPGRGSFVVIYLYFLYILCWCFVLFFFFKYKLFLKCVLSKQQYIFSDNFFRNNPKIKHTFKLVRAKHNNIHNYICCKIWQIMNENRTAEKSTFSKCVFAELPFHLPTPKKYYRPIAYVPTPQICTNNNCNNNTTTINSNNNWNMSLQIINRIIIIIIKTIITTTTTTIIMTIIISTSRNSSSIITNTIVVLPMVVLARRLLSFFILVTVSVVMVVMLVMVVVVLVVSVQVVVVVVLVVVVVVMQWLILATSAVRQAIVEWLM